MTTPILIAVASLVGRRWGSSVSGWLVGLPFTSGPVVFFIALDQGTSFAAATATAVLGGAIASVVFAFVYAQVAFRTKRRWPLCLGAGYLALVIVTFYLEFIEFSTVFAFIAAVLVLLLSIHFFPRFSIEASSTKYPRWDLPARMIAATLFVLLVTDFAGALGSHLSGLITPFPVYTSILAVFNQGSSGIGSALALLRGLLYGLFSFVVFFLVVALSIGTLGTLPTFAIALGIAIVVQGITFRLLNRTDLRLRKPVS